MICNRLDDERILGIHYVGPNAGEIMQGFAIAMKLIFLFLGAYCNRMGARRADLEGTVGIHPTIAEEILLTRITKRSGENPEKTGC